MPPYVKQPWQDNVTLVDKLRMDHIEDGIVVADASATAAGTAAAAADGKATTALARVQVPAVVNGQWLKGVGGAAVWSGLGFADLGDAIADNQLPGQLRAVPQVVANLDTTDVSGWYYFTPTTVGIPPGSGYGYVQVYAYPGALSTTQIAYEHGGNKIWTRSKAPGGTAVWAQLPPTPYATTLPAGPVDGQETILVDSLAAPTFSWRMRYNTAFAKWDFVGGRELVIPPATPGSSQSFAAGGSFVLYTKGPVFTVPRAGVYRMLVVGLRLAQVDAGVANSFTLIFSKNSALTSGWTWFDYTPGVAGAITWPSFVERQQLAAGDTVRIAGRPNLGCTLTEGFMLVQPITMT